MTHVRESLGVRVPLHVVTASRHQHKPWAQLGELAPYDRQRVIAGLRVEMEIVEDQVVGATIAELAYQGLGIHGPLDLDIVETHLEYVMDDLLKRQILFGDQDSHGHAGNSFSDKAPRSRR